ncbi:hypothetical protein evm_014753 [Chilo suppressalis]|nr:hypothetical protein evm_014753 [Chilo suppressalis]
MKSDVFQFHHHHQPINVPTAGAQAFPMDGIGRLGHGPPRGPSADGRALTTVDAAGTNGLTCLPEHGGTRDSKFLDTHLMTDHWEKSIIRAKPKTTTKFRYEIDETFDDHKCPYFCPNAYSPVCMSVNRGEGKYFKYFTFINHCYADMYYCKHYHELGPAPTRDYEDVQVSPLGWSFCGAFRYLQFARYSEVLSSMGHYGWLAGDYRYSHIMEPHQRMPGYG